jgi:hypothetical protein
MQVLENQDVELAIRCKAFSGEGVRLNRVLVEPGRNGAVLVWDSVAGHYTSCHSLSDKTQAKIRSQAINFWSFEHFHGKKVQHA